jgi:hypothetical protein
MARGLASVWTEGPDESTKTYRRHVRGLLVGWAVTAVAMALLEFFPNEGKLSMYGLLTAPGLPWQQQWLAAIEIAAPMLMAWHANALRLWGKKRFAQG